MHRIDGLVLRLTIIVLLAAASRLDVLEAFGPAALTKRRTSSYAWPQTKTVTKSSWAKASRLFISLHDDNEKETSNEEPHQNDSTDADADVSSNTDRFSPKRAASSVVGGAATAVASRISRLAQRGSSDVKKAASVASSGLSGLATKGTRDVKKVASAASAGLSGIAEKGTSDLQNAASAAGSGLTGLAEKGTSDLQNAASAAGSGLSGLATKGTSDLQNVGSSLSGLASKGTADVRSATRAAQSGLTEWTKKGSSDATSVAQWLDAQAKDGAEAASTRAKDLVLKFTGKSEYRFGDITIELMRRATSPDSNLQDVLLLLKVFLAVGVSIGPLAKILPVTVLVPALNVSLETRLGEAILKVLAGSLDERFSAALTASEIGDLAKRGIAGAIFQFTGKDSYEKGDIERAVMGETANETQDNMEDGFGGEGGGSPKTLELFIGKEFADWDEQFREQHPTVDLVLEKSLETVTPGASREALDSDIVNELEEWDAMFRQKYPDVEL